MVHHPYVVRPYPLLTPRIAFQRAPSPPLPVLSTHVEYNLKSFTRKRQHSQNEDDSRQAKRNRQGKSSSPPPAREESDESDEDDMNSSGASSSSATQRQSSPLIPKPQGEPGRPGAGGYKLEATLSTHNWTKDTIEEFMKMVKEKAREKLNPAATFSKQNKQKIQDICDEIQSSMPHLGLARFEGCWPVTAALKAHLKYTAEYSRRLENKAAVDRMRSAAQGE